MSAGREPPPDARRALADAREQGGDARDARRDRIDVRPEDVWQPGPPAPPPRWAMRSFFAPILRVVAISALLLYGLLALGGALWAWLR